MAASTSRIQGQVAPSLLPGFVSLSKGEGHPLDGHSQAVSALSVKALNAVQGYAQGVIQNWKAQSPGTPAVGCGLVGAQGAVSDVSYFVRSLMENFPFFNESPVDAAMGLTTAMHSIWGVVATYRASYQVLAAEKVGYEGGVLAGRVDQVRGVVQSLGGTVILGHRALTMASLIEGAESSPETPSLLGRATFFVGSVVNVLWTAFYAVLSVMTGIALYQGAELETELETHIDLQKFLSNPESLTREELIKYVEYLEKWTLTGSKTDLEEKIKRKFSPEELSSEALKTGGEMIQNLLKELKKEGFAVPDLSDEECQAVLRDLFESEGAPSQGVLAQMGFDIKLAKMQMKKELKLSSLTNSDCLEMMKKAGAALKEKLHVHANQALSVRLKGNDPTALQEARALVASTSRLVKELKGNLESNKTLNWINFVLFSLQTLAMAAIFIFTGGIGPLVIGIVTAVLAFGMMCTSGYSALQAMEKDTPAVMDRTMFNLSSVASLVAIMLSIVLTSVFSFGIVPLVAVVVIGGAWLLINGKVWHKLNENQAKQDRELKIFHQALYANAELEKVRQIYARLSSEERSEFQQMMLGAGESELSKAMDQRSIHGLFGSHPKAAGIKAKIRRIEAAIEAEDALKVRMKNALHEIMKGTNLRMLRK